jgi:hypothetical protein
MVAQLVDQHIQNPPGQKGHRIKYPQSPEKNEWMFFIAAAQSGL